MSNITSRFSYPFTDAYVDAGNTLMMPPPLCCCYRNHSPASPPGAHSRLNTARLGGMTETSEPSS